MPCGVSEGSGSSADGEMISSHFVVIGGPRYVFWISGELDKAGGMPDEPGAGHGAKIQKIGGVLGRPRRDVGGPCFLPPSRRRRAPTCRWMRTMGTMPPACLTAGRESTGFTRWSHAFEISPARGQTECGYHLQNWATEARSH